MSGELADCDQLHLKTPRQSYLNWKFPDETWKHPGFGIKENPES